VTWSVDTASFARTSAIIPNISSNQTIDLSAGSIYTDAIILPASTTATISLSSDTLGGQLTADNLAVVVEGTGGQVNFGQIEVSGTFSINGAVEFYDSVTTANLQLNSGTLTVTSGASLTISRLLDIRGGTATLEVDPSIAGVSIVSGGELSLGADLTGFSNLTQEAGATIAASTSETISSVDNYLFYTTTTNTSGTTSNLIDSIGTLTVTGPGTTTVALSSNTTLSTGLTLRGTGTVTLASERSDNAITTVGAPTLVDASSAFGGGTLQLEGGAMIYSSVADTYSNAVIHSGTGTQRIGRGVGADAALTFEGSLANSGLGTRTLVFDNPAGLTWSGDITLSDALNTPTLQLQVDSDATISGVIADGTTTSGFTKSGTGTLTLSGSNTFTGTTNVAGGTLALTGALTGDIDVSSNSTFAMRTSGGTLSQTLSGSGELLIDLPTNSDILVLTQDNPFNGTTTISSGHLQFGARSSAGSVNGPIVNNGYLDFLRSDGMTFPYRISGTGNIEILDYSLTLTGDNTFSGTTSIYDGATLYLGDGGAAGSLQGVIIPSGTAELVINRSNQFTLSAQIAGSGFGTVTVASGHPILTNGSNSWDSTTIDSGAILQVGNGSVSGSLPGDVVNNGRLIFYPAADIVFTSDITGSGTIEVLGEHTVTFTGTTSTGGMEVASGSTLRISADTAAPIQVNQGGTIQYITASGTPITQSGALSGNGSITVDGGGELILTGTHTLSGGITVSGGSSVSVGTSTIAGSIAAPVTLTTASDCLIFNTSGTPTFNRVISGLGCVDVQQSVIFTGTNTYTGGTTISSGATLTLGSGGTFGSIAGPIVVDGELAINRSNVLSLGGVISGAGTLNVNKGQLRLTGDNTFSGTTTVAAGATLSIGIGGSTGQLAGDIANNGTVIFNGSTDWTYGGTLSGSGATTKLGSNTLSFSLAPSTTGAVTVSQGALQFGTGNTTAAGTYAFDVAVANNATLIHNHASGSSVVQSGVVSGAGDFTLTGGIVDFVLRADSTLTGAINVLGASHLNIGDGTGSGSIQGSAVVGASSQLIFANNSASSYAGSISGSGLVDFQTGLSLTGNSDGFAGTVDVGGTLTFGDGGSSGSIGGDLQLASATLVINRSNTVTLSGAITDTAGNGILQVSAGRAILTNMGNTYAGGTTVDSGATLQIGDGTTSGSLPGDVVNNGQLVFYPAADITFAGDISGSGIIEVLGDYTVTFTGNVSSSGTIEVDSGTLVISGDSSAPIQVASNAAVQFATASGTPITQSGALSGSGDVQITGGGELILTGSHTISGTTTISGGSTLTLGDGSSSGSFPGNIVLASATDTVCFDIPDFIYTGTISGLGIVEVKVNTIFTRNQLYTGSTNITSTTATLTLGNGGATGSLVSDLTILGTLAVNRSNLLTLGGVLSGAGGNVSLLSGQLALTADNTYTGTTTVAAGTTLYVGNGGSAGQITSDVVNSGSLIFNRTTDTTYSNTISGIGTVTKLGSNTLSFSADNGYTGTTSVRAGTLLLGTGGATGSLAGPAVVSTNATLGFNRGSALTESHTITGTGNLSVAGGFTLILTGANTLSGTATVSGGSTLQIGDGSTSGTIATGIVLGSSSDTLAFDRSDGLSFSPVISGDGALSVLGDLVLTGNHTITGTTTVASGVTLSLGAGGASGTVAGPIVTNGNLLVNRGNSVTLASAITGTGTVQIASGTTVLTNTGNGWTSGTTIDAGATLQVGDGVSSGSLSGDVTNNGTLLFYPAADIVFGGDITGSGDVEMIGPYNVIFAGGGGSGGGTVTVNPGSTLVVSADSTDNYLISDTGILQFVTVSGTPITQSGVISGEGAVQIVGGGELILTSSLIPSGEVTVSGGSTLTIGDGSTSLGLQTNILLDSLTDLICFNAPGSTFTGVISGSGAVEIKADTIFALDQTYTGGTTISDTGATLTLGTGAAAGGLVGDVTILGTLAVNRSNQLTLAGTLSGSSGNVTLTRGQLVLSADNTYTGTTTVSADTTLTIGGPASSTGQITSDIANEGTVIFQNATDWTYGNTISGTGGVSKFALNTLTFTLDQTYTGTTNVQTGTLVLGTGGTSGDLAGPVTIPANGTLTYNRSGTVTNANLLSGSGNFTLSGGLTLVLTATNSFAGTATVSGGSTLQIGAGGTSGVLPSNIVLSSSSDSVTFHRSDGLSYTQALSGFGNLNVSGDLILTTNNTLSGTTTIATGATLTLGTGFSTGLVSGPIVNNGILALNRNAAYNLSGAITGTGELQVLSGAPSLTSSSNSFNGGVTIAVDASLQVGNGVLDGLLPEQAVTNNGTLIFNRVPTGGSSTFAGLISGTGGVEKRAVDTVILTGLNTYTGLTRVVTGTLQIGNSSSLGALPGPADVATGASLVFYETASSTYAETITGRGTWVINETPTGGLVLTSDNSFSGTLTINGGQVSIGDGGITGSFSGDIVNHATLIFDRSDAYTHTGLIEGSGAMTIAGDVIFTRNHPFTGTTTITGTGTLTLGNGGAVGSVAGPIVNNGILAIDRSNTLFLDQAVSGLGSLQLLSGVTTLVNDSNSWSGGVSIASGATLQVGNGSTDGLLPDVNIANDGLVRFDRSTGTALTYGGVISGNGSLIKRGEDTLTFTADQTYTGSTTVRDGVLVLGDGSSASGSLAGDVEILYGAIIRYDRIGSLTQSGAFTGLGALEMDGGLTLILTGDGTLSGDSIITSGTLQLGDGSSTGWIAPSLILASPSANLVFNRSDAVTFPRPISGTGAVAINGDVTLAANQSYTGDTTINSGAIARIGTGTATGRLTSDVTNNGTLIFNSSGSWVYANTITGSGAVEQAGDSTLTFSTDQSTLTGTTTVSAGFLQIGNRGTAGLIAGPIVVATNGTLVYDRTDSLLRSATISGAGAMVLRGGITLIVSGSVGADSGITVAGGCTLQVGNGGTSGTITSPVILGSGTLLFNRSNSISFGQVISGEGTVNITGTVILTGNNTYRGTTSIPSGAALTLQPASGTEAISGTITNAGTLLVSANYTSETGDVINQIIGGSSSFEINGTATLSGRFNAIAATGVTFSLGDSFTLLEATSISGTFGNVGLPSLQSGLDWGLTYSSTTLVAEVAESAFEIWALGRGLDPLFEGATFEDAEFDSLPNVVEFGFGLDPLVHDAAPLEVISATEFTPGAPITEWEVVNGVTHGTIRFVRMKDYPSANLVYRIEVSENLATWSAVDATLTVISSQGDYEVVEAEFTIDPDPVPGRHFSRVVVESLGL